MPQEVNEVKKTMRIDDACKRYSLGKHSMREVAEAAGAVVRVGRVYLINCKLVDEYMDKIAD